VIRSATGLAGVSPDILQHGVDALKKQLPPQDYPEVIAVCDTLATGLATRLPGVNTIGIAAESDAVPDGAGDPGMPCVVGLKGLLDAVSNTDILIIDGDKGRVELDPDPKTLVAYQHRDDARIRGRSLFIEARHLPARTQTGETVLVYARASCEQELALAVDSGADGLVAAPFEPYGRACYDTILRIALGKPTAILSGTADKDLLRSAARMASANQVTVLFPASHYATLSRRMADSVAHVAEELLAEDLDIPDVAVGTLALTGRTSPNDEHEPVFHLVDMREPEPLKVRQAVVRQWVAALQEGQVAFDIAGQTRQAKAIVRAGARNLVTTPDLVPRVKDAIRTIGLEEGQ
jgi:phosphoenolpyruvate-protein kinase (PTS system EI component)